MRTNPLFQKPILFLALAALPFFCFAQNDAPTDFLSPAFHKGRREAARALMPEHSVMLVFAAPERTFSNDVDYLFHQNPDLYYFTGYKEPHAVLLLFKEPQPAPGGGSYSELFFVQKRDAQREQWTGKRLGVSGVKKKLGFDSVYNGENFNQLCPDLNSFSLLFELPKGVADNPSDPADLFDLVATFKQKAHLPADYNADVNSDLNRFARMQMTDRLVMVANGFSKKQESDAAYRRNAYITAIAQTRDTIALQKIQKSILADKMLMNDFWQVTATLREIKTPEEMVLIRKAVEISCAGQNEVMTSLRPEMSELEIQGLHEYVHKKYGAEEVGYGSIIGSGENGCVLHYMENSRTAIGTDMLLMDVGAAYHGYTADVTRTIPSGGKFSAEEKAIYQLVYEAQEAAFKLLKDGAKWSDAGTAAKEVIANGLLKLGIIKNKADVAKYYPHGLSHHMGLDVHDKGISQRLKKGMVITIEPGIYIPSNSDCDKKWWGIAVRIEDDVLIREKDFELLSASAPRSIADIEKRMRDKSKLKDYVLPPLPSDVKKAF